jgi:hypothetical protein
LKLSDSCPFGEVIQIDPDALLDELVQLGHQLAESRDREQAQELLREIIQKSRELREWLDKGGFTPRSREENKDA